MPWQALVLVLLAAAGHASWNVLAKRAAGVVHFNLACSLVSVVVFAAPAVLCVAAGTVPISGSVLAALLGTSVIHAVYVEVLRAGYRAADLSVVYPVARGSGPLASFLGAVVLLGEPLSAGAAAGALSVTAGVVLLATREGAAPSWVGVRWGLGTGACIAAYTLVDGFAVRSLGVPPVVLDFVSNLVRVALFLPLALADRPRALADLRGSWREALTVGVLGPLSYVLVLTALRWAPISRVAPAREVSMLFGAVLGATLLRERGLGRRLTAAALVTAGVVLLATSR